MNQTVDRARGEGRSLRGLLLLLIQLGIVGLLAELILLEHTESATQWIPLLSLTAGLVTGLAVALRASPATVRAFRVVMGVCVVAGLLGVWFHLQGNMEFERERDASLSGLKLLWESLRGATPALAPGALFQLGLLGLAYAYRHPALEAARMRATR